MGVRPRLQPVQLAPRMTHPGRALRALRVLQAAASAPTVLGEDDAVAFAVDVLRGRRDNVLRGRS